MTPSEGNLELIDCLSPAAVNGPASQAIRAVDSGGLRVRAVLEDEGPDRVLEAAGY